MDWFHVLTAIQVIGMLYAVCLWYLPPGQGEGVGAGAEGERDMAKTQTAQMAKTQTAQTVEGGAQKAPGLGLSQKALQTGLDDPWTAIGPEPEPQVGPVSRAFLLAGQAHFTAESPKGQRFTFRITRALDKATGQPSVPARFFGSVLTGPDNTRNYTYLGCVDPQTLKLYLTKGSKRGEDDQAVKVLRWVLAMIDQGQAFPAGYRVHHEGRCGRCGRLLTVPESILAGLGPECAGKV